MTAADILVTVVAAFLELSEPLPSQGQQPPDAPFNPYKKTLLQL